MAEDWQVIPYGVVYRGVFERAPRESLLTFDKCPKRFCKSRRKISSNQLTSQMRDTNYHKDIGQVFILL